MRRRLSHAFQPPAAVVRLRLRAPSGADVVTTEALVDTGADMCAISERVAAALDLPPVRTSRVAGVFEIEREIVIYRVELEIVGVGVFHAEAFGLEQGNAIVGRNVLRRLVLRVDGPREVLSLESPAGSCPPRPRRHGP